MRVHHKQPAFVSMWMLDVFCCALGCVTLLWLLNTRQAADQAVAAKTALHELLSTRGQLDVSRTDRESTQRELLAVRSELDGTRARLEAEAKHLNEMLLAARREKDETARKLGIAEAEAKAARELLDATKLALNSAEKKLDINAKDLATTVSRAADAEDLLRKKQRDADALAKKLTDAAMSAEDLAKLAKKNDDERAAAAKLAAELQAKLDDFEAKLRLTRKEADAAKTTTTQTATDLAAAAGRLKDLEKKLTDANAMIIDLQGEKGKLADKYDKMQHDSENKFAGIAMTGKRVVFLVDRSGSMDRTSEQVLAPTKWPVVAETVAKVMRSMPDLQQFQVIVFSKEARWLFGNGDWQSFNGEKSAVEVKDALLKTKVEGDTNLYAAFDLAFQQRDRGMDTLYLFSDGLPTSGPGLSDEQLRQNPPLRVTEQSEILSRYVRSRLMTTWNRALAGRPKVRINSVGFFYESPDVGAFLWALSRENDGSFVGMSRP